MSTKYSRNEVAKHNTSLSAWIIIDNIVYDITKFAKYHPGGEALILEYAGKDCTEIFWDLHHMQKI